MSEAVTIMGNGRDRLVLLSEYARLERRVVKLENFTDADMALIDQAEVPAEHSHLDSQLKDWRPRVGRSPRRAG